LKQTEGALDGRTLGRLDRWRNAKALFIRPEGGEVERAVAQAFGRRWVRAQVYGRARRLLLESDVEVFLENLYDRLGSLADRVRVAPDDPGTTKWDSLGNLSPLPLARTEVRSLWLADLLRHGDFYAKFQPVADLRTGDVIGYEGLLRARAESANHPSAEMFPAARALSVERPFEILSWSCIVESADRLPAESRLFVNVNPQLLVVEPDGLSELWRAIDASSLSASRIILDLVEGEKVDSLDALSRAVAETRKRGAQVALDDVTSPYRTIQSCEAFHPEWVKVDSEITRGVARDPRRRSILKSLGRLARHFSFGLIAEGVESGEDLEVCAASGVSAAQGYFIGRPAPDPAAPEGAFLRWVQARARESRPVSGGTANGAEDEQRAS
jgi:EAL domain-containing protein (putative c-di-GMP-specific phosphodiesterase class I)